AARNRTLFAQRRLRPTDVLPEWQRTLAVLGSEEDVERFVTRATTKLGTPLEPWRGHWKLYTDHLRHDLRERLEREGMTGTQRVDFHQPPAAGATFIHRTHPLVACLADFLLETALATKSSNEANELDWIARAGAVFTNAVQTRTTVLLLRLRHQLNVTH